MGPEEGGEPPVLSDNRAPHLRARPPHRPPAGHARGGSPDGVPGAQTGHLILSLGAHL